MACTGPSVWGQCLDTLPAQTREFSALVLTLLHHHYCLDGPHRVVFSSAVSPLRPHSQFRPRVAYLSASSQLYRG